MNEKSEHLVNGEPRSGHDYYKHFYRMKPHLSARAPLHTRK